MTINTEHAYKTTRPRFLESLHTCTVHLRALLCSFDSETYRKLGLLYALISSLVSGLVPRACSRVIITTRGCIYFETTMRRAFSLLHARMLRKI